MSTFDYLTLLAFYNENKNFIINSRIIKIQQPTKRDILLTLKNNNTTKKLYININPQTYHICFASDVNLIRRNIIIPKQPPMFCMLLRKYINRCKIIGLNVPEYERIFEILLETYDELNQKSVLCLSIELMGKHSNIILYNADTKYIIGCAHNVSSEKSTIRELSGTLPYIYPPKQSKKNILNYYGIVNYDNLNSEYAGISSSFQNLLKINKTPLHIIKNYMRLKSNIEATIDGDKFSIYSDLLPNGIKQNTVSEMIDNYFSKNQEKLIIESLKQKLLHTVYPPYKKILHKLKNIDLELPKKDKSDLYKKYGDMILTNMYSNKDYISTITITDNLNNKEEIRLNKYLTLKENAMNYYKLYKKNKNKRNILYKLREEYLYKKEHFEQILYSIENSNNIDILLEIDEELNSEFNKIKSNNKTSTTKIKEISADKYTIYIGQNNKQNDYIVSKLSSSEDFWFHVKNNPGSHVLLKMKNDQKPDEKILYTCCKFAKQYSKAKLNKKCPVIFTQRKNLKKPPKSALGYVTYKNETEVVVSD